MKFKNYSRSDQVFYVFSFVFLLFFFLIVLYPIVFVVSSSFSSGVAVSGGKVVLWPVDFSLDGYKTVFNNRDIMLGFKNSVLVAVIGTVVNIVVTMVAAYCMSRDDVPFSNQIMLIFTFTMFFGGGMIPSYMLVRDLGLIDSMWSLILPGSMSVYNMIIARTFIRSSIPHELLEASQMDGCSDIRYFLQIVIPLSKPVIAILVLYYGVGHWNTYFNAMLYLNDKAKFTLPIFLKQILIANQIDPSTVSDPELQMKIAQTADVIKYALIVVSTVPVLVIYPFVQKHFVQGVMIGSIKG